jgi:hypothetical protein
MASSNLQAIQTKVRKLTRSPVEELLSTSDLNDYINTFILYDFPEHLRLFYFKTTLTFFTQPFVDTYTTDSVPGLEDFKNKYYTVHPPFYIAGRVVTLSQSRQEFFNTWPLNSFLAQIAAGDGITTTFSGNLAAVSGVPVLQNQVSFSSLDTSLVGLAVQDVPIDNTLGNLVTVADTPLPAGSINYVTGDYSVTFPTPPGPGQVVQAQVKPYVASLPIAVLFYDTTFTLRPVPDMAYRVEMDAFIRPTELLAGSDVPGLEEFWQFISYGAAKKVFEDRMDLDSVQLILPEYHKQENLILRRTIVQKTNQRTSTIYTTNGYGEGWGYNYWGYM